MDTRTSIDAEERERELVITRIFDAPRHLVFQAWTEPDRATRWWGPQGFVTTYPKSGSWLGLCAVGVGCDNRGLRFRRG